MAKVANADVYFEKGKTKIPSFDELKSKLKLDENDLVKLGRVEKAYNKYNSDVNPDLYLKIVLNDPTTIEKKEVDGKKEKPIFHKYQTKVKVKATTKELEKDENLQKNLDKDGFYEKVEVRFLMLESGIKKLGSYSRWLVTNTINQNILVEDLEDAKELLESFNRFKNNIKEIDFESADINNYNCLSSIVNSKEKGVEEKALIDIVSKFRKPSESDDENLLIENRYYINSKEAELFFEDEEWMVVIPKTPEASSFYANNTNWCTRRQGQFENYTSRGDLHIFIDKTKLNKHEDKMRRLQFHFEDNMFMDIDDRSINNTQKYNEVSDWFDEYDWKFVKKDKELIQIKLKRDLTNLNDEKLKSFIKDRTSDITEELRLKILNYLLKRFVDNNNYGNGEDKILLLKDCFPEQREYLELKFIDTKDYSREELENHFERISNLKKAEKEELLEIAITKVIPDFRVLYPYYRKQGKKFIIQNVVQSSKYFDSETSDQYIEDIKECLSEKEIVKIIMEIIDCFDDSEIKDSNKSCYKILDSFPEALRFICSSPEEELKNL